MPTLEKCPLVETSVFQLSGVSAQSSAILACMLEEEYGTASIEDEEGNENKNERNGIRAGRPSTNVAWRGLVVEFEVLRTHVRSHGGSRKPIWAQGFGEGIEPLSGFMMILDSGSR